jgi:hypothetical protein
MALEFKDENDLEIIASNSKHTESSESNQSSVDGLLPIDEDKIKPTESEDEDEEIEGEGEGEENPAKVQTKHDFVTSPWSRLGVIGGAFGVGFIAMYAVINPMMGGGGGETAKKPEPTPTPTETAKAFEQKDGDAYAKLALQKQQSELESLNGKEEKPETNLEEEALKDKKPADSTTKTPVNKTTAPTKPTKVTPQQTPPAPSRRTYRENPEPEVRPRRSALLAARTEAPRPVMTMPKISIPTRDNNNAIAIVKSSSAGNTISSPKDPLAEIERLRNVGNIGRVEYSKTDENSNLIANSQAQETIPEEESPRRSRRSRRGGDIGESATITSANGEQATPNNTDEPEELRPRWEPASYNQVEFTAANKQLDNENFLAQEARILEGQQPQYLVVGSSTKATLITPLILTQGTTNGKLRFVARLDEPIKSNIGAVAIPAGTQVAVAVSSVDAGFNIYAEVTAILKDQTEYPVTSGAISILGKGNAPLIARPFKDKGGEIARYDGTLAAVAGLAKLGEIMNKPDSSTTQNLPLGGTVTSTSGGGRNVTGALLEGAFGALGQSINSRTQAANSEIASRPNVWYVPANTKVSILVNRSIKLP